MQISAAVIVDSLLQVLIESVLQAAQPAGRLFQIKQSDFVFHQQKVQEIICLSHVTGQRVRILDFSDSHSVDTWWTQVKHADELRRCYETWRVQMIILTSLPAAWTRRIQFCLHFTLRDKVGQNCETGHNVTGEGERKASQRAAIYVAWRRCVCVCVCVCVWPIYCSL